MQKSQMQNEVLSFLSNQVNIPIEALNATEELKNTGLDSFQIIEMVLFIERKFGIVIPDHAYTPGNLRSVDSIVNCAMEYKM